MKKTLSFFAAVLLLSLSLTMTSCGNSAFPTEASDSGSGTVSESRPEVTESIPSDTGETQALHLSEPPKKELPPSIGIEVHDSLSGTVENAEGEKIAYCRAIYREGKVPENVTEEELEEMVDVEGDVSMLNRIPKYTFAGMEFPSFVDMSVNYSDKITLTTDEKNVRYALSSNSAWSVPQITCTGNGQKKVSFEWEKNKLTISGDDVSYKFGPRLYYYAPGEDYGGILPEARVSKFTVEGKTDGSVTLEKREDGWHLSGADGEVKLRAEGSDEYYDLHHDEFPIIITASPEDDIHIEEYIPEVKELYK